MLHNMSPWTFSKRTETSVDNGARAANRYRPDMDALPKPWTGTALGITSWGRGGELTRNSHGPLIVSYSYTKNDQKQKKRPKY